MTPMIPLPLSSPSSFVIRTLDMNEVIEAIFFALASIIIAVITIVITLGIYILCSGAQGIQLRDGIPGAFDDSEQFAEEEANALELMDDRSRQSYLMAKRWIDHNPPNSADTDISLSQYMTIQEKAVAAWEFTFDILQQPFIMVRNRTELEFRGSDDIGCVQTNLPLPKQKDVYYWEAKIYDMDPDTRLSVGLTTKPYPMFRLPGMHRYSVSYESTAHRRLNQPFSCPSYGRKWQRGDVIGVGYRTRSGTVFFTHNGKKLDDVVHGLRLNVFPTVGATGPANIYVNLGQDGFVFIQANVKEWGLAPAQGSLAPPPAYGDQHDSLLLESTGNPGPSSAGGDIPEAPPYIRRRSSDDAHVSVDSGSDGIHTPPGSPPMPPPPRPSISSQSGDEVSDGVDAVSNENESNEETITESTSTPQTTSEDVTEFTSSQPGGEPNGDDSSIKEDPDRDSDEEMLTGGTPDAQDA